MYRGTYRIVCIISPIVSYRGLSVSFQPYGRCVDSESDHKIFGHMLLSLFISTSCEIALRWMQQKNHDEKSTLVQIMAWCMRQQPITWANVDTDLCHHMASLGHNGLMSVRSSGSIRLHNLNHTQCYLCPITCWLTLLWGLCPRSRPRSLVSMLSSSFLSSITFIKIYFQVFWKHTFKNTFPGRGADQWVNSNFESCNYSLLSVFS